MTTQLIPFSFDAHEVRIIDRFGEVWFVATDVATALEYRDSANMARNLDDDEKGTHIVSTLGGNQALSIINESGLYAVILKSRKKEAKRFRKLVTSEVLPAIRKTGQYTNPSFRQERTRKALPGGLTIEQQDAVKALVKSRVEALPKDGQAKAAIMCWSAIKSKFGVSYKEVPSSEFAAVLSLVARLDLADEPKALPFELHYPIESAAPPTGMTGLNYCAFNSEESKWTDPGWELLMKLRAAGFNVDGPVYSHHAKIHIMAAFYNGLIKKAVENIDVATAMLPYAPIYLR